MRRTLTALALCLSVLLTGCGSADPAVERKPEQKTEKAAPAADAPGLTLAQVEDACKVVSAKVLQQAGVGSETRYDDCTWSGTRGEQVRMLSTRIGGALQGLGGRSGSELASGLVADLRAEGGERVSVAGAAEAVSKLDDMGGITIVGITARYRNVLVEANVSTRGGPDPSSFVPVAIAAAAEVVAELRKRAEDTSDPSAGEGQLVPDAEPGACSAITREHLADLGLVKKDLGCMWMSRDDEGSRSLVAMDLDAGAGTAERSYQRMYERAAEDGEARDVEVPGADEAKVVVVTDHSLGIKLFLRKGGQVVSLRYTVSSRGAGDAPDAKALEAALVVAAADIVKALQP